MSEQLASGSWAVNLAAVPPNTGSANWVEGASLTRIAIGHVEVRLNRPTDVFHFEGQATLAADAVAGAQIAVVQLDPCTISILTSISGIRADAAFYFDFRRKG